MGVRYGDAVDYRDLFALVDECRNINHEHRFNEKFVPAAGTVGLAVVKPWLEDVIRSQNLLLYLEAR